MPFGMAWRNRPADDMLELVFPPDGYVGVRLLFEWNGTRWGGRREAFTLADIDR